MKNLHWDGQVYKENSQMQYHEAIKLLQQYSFKGNENILDVGCGSGKTTQAIKKLVPDGNVLGIDASQSMIEAAKKEYQQKNLDFQLMDAQQLSFVSTFDLATSFFCIQWIPNRQLVFDNVFKALKPGASFLMLAAYHAHPKLVSLRTELMRAPDFKNYFIDFVDPLSDVNQLRYDDFATEAGFELSYYDDKPTPIIYKNEQEFFGFLYAVTPQLSQLKSEAEKNLFIQRILEGYLKDSPVLPDGSIQIDFYFAKLIGRKPS